MQRTINPSELKALIEKKSATVIDVRRKNDYDADNVKIPGAQWKNPDDVSKWAKDLSTNSDVVIYCVRGGSVSNSVVDHLQGQGVKARFIEGGIETWKQSGGVTVPK